MVLANKKLLIALIAVLTGILLLLASCDSLPEECRKSLGRPFWAKVEGEIDGREVMAEVYCDPTEHKTKEIFNRLIVRFDSPRALEGITVSLRSDGLATVRLKDTEVEMPIYREMTEPYLALTPFGELYSQNKTNNGYEMTYKQGGDTVTYYFGTDGVLKGARGTVDSRSFDLTVTNFRQISKKIEII